MKKALFVIIITFITSNIHSQTHEEKPNFKNEIDFMVSDLIDGAYQLQYERLITKNFSLNLGVGYKGPEGLVRLSGLNKENLKTGEITYSGFRVIIEARYYIKQTSIYSGDGFYFGAYLKNSNYKTDLNGTYIDDGLETYKLAFDADIGVTSIGLMVGYKLPISKRLSIDFLFAGPGKGTYDFKLKNNEDLPEEFYEDFNKALEEYSLFDFLNGDFRFSDSNVKSKFSIFSFRYGISLGYSF